MSQFEEFGYYLDYFIDNKFIGSLVIGQKEREEIGYYGKKHDVSQHDIKLSNKKVIKKGQEYYTYLYPLCSKKK